MNLYFSETDFLKSCKQLNIEIFNNVLCFVFSLISFMICKNTFTSQTNLSYQSTVQFTAR